MRRSRGGQEAVLALETGSDVIEEADESGPPCLDPMLAQRALARRLADPEPALLVLDQLLHDAKEVPGEGAQGLSEHRLEGLVQKSDVVVPGGLAAATLDHEPRLVVAH